MPVIGDAPITSYFSRVSPTSKRKGSSGGSSAARKRRKQATSESATTPVAEASSKKKGKEREILDFYEPKSSPLHKSSTSPTPIPPQTPITKAGSSRDKEDEIVPPTPPPTLNAPSRLAAASFLKEHQPYPHTPLPAVSAPRQQLPTLLPTPTTNPRVQTRSFRKPMDNEKERDPTHSLKPGSRLVALQPTAFEFRKDKDSGLAPAELEMPIPSSQSQDIMHIPDADLCSMSRWPAEKHLAIHDSATGDDDDRRSSLSSEEDAFVGSSQSQPDLTFANSPRKRRRKRNPICSEKAQSSQGEIIPSSQSQENELMMPSELDKRPIWRQQNRPSFQPSSSKPKDSQTRLPQRTLSDEMFSVPIQNSILAGIFADDDLETNHLSYKPTHIPDNEDSVTESEDEYQPKGLEKPSGERHGLWLEDSQLTSTPAAMDATQDVEMSHSSESTSQDLGSSCASLPSAVKDFQQMFSSGDGSYPADFPESLRS